MQTLKHDKQSQLVCLATCSFFNVVHVGSRIVPMGRCTTFQHSLHLHIAWFARSQGQLPAASPHCRHVSQQAGRQHQTASCCCQASDDQVPTAMAEAARQAALRAKDVEAAERAELEVVAALLGCQFGPADVDHALGLVTLQVGRRTAAP